MEDGKPKVLLIDDDEVITAMTEHKLSKEGYDVLIAQNGQEGIDIFKKENPSIIISDLMMPFISGLEFLEHIREVEKSRTPVIVLSSSGQEEIVMQAFHMGADDFISKPFSINELRMRIANQLRKSNQ